MRFSLSNLGFLRWGWTEQCWNWSGKIPVERDRLMICVIVGRRTDEHCLRREVGIGSRSQFVSGDWDSSFETSSTLIGLRDEKLGGVTGGGRWGETQARLDNRAVCSLWILSEKNVANDWDRFLSESEEGKVGAEERWRSWLTDFHSSRGLVREEEMRDELNFLLAFMIAAWYRLVADRKHLRSSDLYLHSISYSPSHQLW